jgi:O-antigen/teichoic acid export membrane protein
MFAGAQVASAVLALALLGVLGRTLGRAGFGEFSFVFVVASFGGLIADFGMGPWISRAAAQSPRDSGNQLRAVLRLRTRTLLVAWAVTLGISTLWLRDGLRLLEVAFMLAYITSLGYLIVYESFLLARERAGRVALSVAGGKLLELACVQAWILAGGAIQVAAIAGVLAISSFVRLAGVAWTTRRIVRADRPALPPGPVTEALESDPLLKRNLAWQVLPFGVGVALSVVYNKVDVILLEKMSTASSLGLYSAAYRILDAMLLIPRSLLGIAYPLFASAWSQGTLNERILGRPARALVAVALALAAGWWVLAGDVLRIVFGEAFAPAAPAARILAVAVVPVFLNQYLGVVLNATHRQHQWLVVIGCALAVNATANLMLIRLFDFRGAAWATVISEFLSLAVFGRLVATKHGWPLSPAWVVRALLSALAMGWLVRSVPAPFVVRVLVGVLAFPLIATILGAIRRDDWDLLWVTGRRLVGSVALLVATTALP